MTRTATRKPRTYIQDLGGTQPGKPHANPPRHCDLCGLDLDTYGIFIDGIARPAAAAANPNRGTWANMCPGCYSEHGMGLGIGVGQTYIRDEQGAQPLNPSTPATEEQAR